MSLASVCGSRDLMYPSTKLSAATLVGASFCHSSGALPMSIRIYSAVVTPRGCDAYSPFSHVGSVRIASRIILRSMRLRPAAAGAVEDEHGVLDHASRVALGATKGRVVQPQLGQGFPACEPEVLDDVVALGGREGGLLRGQRRRADQRQRQHQTGAIPH